MSGLACCGSPLRCRCDPPHTTPLHTTPLYTRATASAPLASSQWVDTDTRTMVVQNGAIGQATRKDRRLYVGNLPLGAGLTEKQVSEFISTSMKQRGMSMNEPDLVLSVWLSPEGTYAFVEFHTVESANNVRL